jgi:hypothetical protein
MMQQNAAIRQFQKQRTIRNLGQHLLELVPLAVFPQITCGVPEKRARALAASGAMMSPGCKTVVRPNSPRRCGAASRAGMRSCGSDRTPMRIAGSAGLQVTAW